MTKSKKDQAKQAKRMIGRLDWGGVKPTTRVIPDKKKPKPHRKRKHKGRLDEAGHFFWGLPQSPRCRPAP